jgi:ectoine hydroxylase-related dioxygenase (phytanoyl-CoA dioxygenase family)
MGEGEQIYSRAMKHAQQGNLDEALVFFQRAAIKLAHRGDVWQNFALALQDKAEEAPDTNSMIAYLHDSIAALDISGQLHNKPALEHKNATMVWLRKLPGASTDCGVGSNESVCLKYAAETAAVKRVVSHPVEVAKEFCTAKTVRIKLSKRERLQNQCELGLMREILSVMNICGLVVLEGGIDADQVQELLNQDHVCSNSTCADRYQEAVEGSVADASSHTVVRSPGRVESKIPLTKNPAATSLLSDELLLSVLRMLLSDKIELDTFSVVRALPGAPAQRWHSDVDQVFRHYNRERRLQPPAQAISLVASLMPGGDALLASHGPTEFSVGTHMEHSLEQWQEFIRAERAIERAEWEAEREVRTSGSNSAGKGGQTASTPQLLRSRENHPTRVISPELKPGDLVLFDLRLRHRGGKNRSRRDRPILYCTVARHWYVDSVNFRRRQTRGWDALPSWSMRKLYSRLDGETYVQTLESLLREHLPNGKGEELLRAAKSELEYKRHELAV